MGAKPSRAAQRLRGVAALREERPQGPKQFNKIVATRTAASSSGASKTARSKAVPPKAFKRGEVERLEKAQKRFEASRRAATIRGRDTVYD